MKAKNKTYLIIAVATLIVFTIAGTYAFFSIIGGNTTTKNVNVTTHTTCTITWIFMDGLVNYPLAQMDNLVIVM